MARTKAWEVFSNNPGHLPTFISLEQHPVYRPHFAVHMNELLLLSLMKFLVFLLFSWVGDAPQNRATDERLGSTKNRRNARLLSLASSLF